MNTEVDKTIVNRNIPIGKMIKDRHAFENKTLAMRNHWRFVSYRVLEEQKKKKQFEKEQR